MTSARLGVLLALVTVIGWSANVIFARLLAQQVPPFTLSLLRTVVALGVFAPFALGVFLRKWPIIRDRLGFYIFLSLTGLGLFNAMVYVAGHTTTAINMSLLSTSSPVFTIVLSRLFLGEPLTVRRIIGIVSAVCGVAMLTTRGDLALLADLEFHEGDLYMLGGSFIFACYNVGLRFKSPDLDNNSLILTTFIVSILFLLPLSAWEVFSGQPVLLTAESITGILYLGIVASILCYICWTAAIARIGPGNVALIYYTIPLFTGLQAVLILGEPLLWIHFAGGGLIIAGVIVATRR